MGTIRNRMVIVHHWNENKLMEIREDAVKTFQKAIDKRNFYIVKFYINLNFIYYE